MIKLKRNIKFEGDYCSHSGPYTGIWSEWSYLEEDTTSSIHFQVFTRRCLPSQKTKAFHLTDYKCSDLLGQGETKSVEIYRERNCFWSQWSEWSCSEPCLKNGTSLSTRYYQDGLIFFKKK